MQQQTNTHHHARRPSKFTRPRPLRPRLDPTPPRPLPSSSGRRVRWRDDVTLGPLADVAWYLKGSEPRRILLWDQVQQEADLHTLRHLPRSAVMGRGVDGSDYHLVVTPEGTTPTFPWATWAMSGALIFYYLFLAIFTSILSLSWQVGKWMWKKVGDYVAMQRRRRRVIPQGSRWGGTPFPLRSSLRWER